MNYIEFGEKISDHLRSLRAELHSNPEPSTFEEITSQIILKELKNIGITDIQTGLGNGKHGIIANIEGGLPGKKVALRADMDALAIEEETDLEFTSKNKGYMHACGHDNHVAMVLGAANIIYQNKDKLKGSVRLIFQPAEELSPEGGAKSMILEGALKDVDAIFGFHVWPELPFGVMGFKEGPLMAASDHFYVNIKGKASHAAGPENGVDAIVAGCEYVGAIQHIVSRNISAIDNAVITVGTINAGTRYNIVAEDFKIEGTCRALSPEVRDLVENRLEEILEGICKVYGCKGDLDYQRGYIPLINDSEMTKYAKEKALDLFGEKYVQDVKEPVLKAEDFGFYLSEKPGSFIWLGTAEQDKDYWPLHNSHFSPNDEVLYRGSAMLAKLAFEFTERNK
ncbi:MAG: M20 family metallopeptidase [Peptoniphilus sp.]|uniref:M20 metallopeptidase family protein n=1 Tax=Peptoniphilus sp. TaxID=1971214 RepID=UPI002A76531E|nr:M20 family metallopeptidase [Peptoniphilus sp.]MDY2987509.1 M20 family metallopeptidase [Peptoniphilus sp.]